MYIILRAWPYCGIIPERWDCRISTFHTKTLTLQYSLLFYMHDTAPDHQSSVSAKWLNPIFKPLAITYTVHFNKRPRWGCLQLLFCLNNNAQRSFSNWEQQYSTHALKDHQHGSPLTIPNWWSPHQVSASTKVVSFCTFPRFPLKKAARRSANNFYKRRLHD